MIYAKEMRSYFVSMTGYAFIAAFLLSTGLFFAVNNVLMNSDSLSNVLLSNCYVMILIVPPLTMRMFAEERRNRTEQMWLCAPIRLSSVVRAKFFAAISVFGMAMAVSLVFALLLAILGTRFFVGEAMIGYLGCALVGLSLISLGMFLSSIFESQLACAVTTSVALLGLYLADSIGGNLPVDGVREVLCAITPYYQLRNFRIGLLLPSAVVQLLSFTAIFYLMTIIVLDARITRSRRIQQKRK